MPRPARLWLLALLALCLASSVWPLLGLPAVFFAFIAALALPQVAPGSRTLKLALWLAAAAATVGVVRFVVEEAAPGIVQGGRTATQRKAVERLREILGAEDALRRLAPIDPDADGVGSAALLGELCGVDPLRSGKALDAPALACRGLVPLGSLLADDGGAYRHIVCLPAPGGGWTASTGAPVDDEEAERQFIAYAWPAPASGFARAFFIDQHERILEADLAEGDLEFRCDAALSPPQNERWRTWMGKRPRAYLPGDRATPEPH